MPTFFRWRKFTGKWIDRVPRMVRPAYESRLQRAFDVFGSWKTRRLELEENLESKKEPGPWSLEPGQSRSPPATFEQRVNFFGFWVEPKPRLIPNSVATRRDRKGTGFSQESVWQLFFYTVGIYILDLSYIDRVPSFLWLTKTTFLSINANMANKTVLTLSTITWSANFEPCSWLKYVIPLFQSWSKFILMNIHQTHTQNPCKKIGKHFGIVQRLLCY